MFVKGLTAGTKACVTSPRPRLASIPRTSACRQRISAAAFSPSRRACATLSSQICALAGAHGHGGEAQPDGPVEGQGKPRKMRSFYGCYLLVSKAPRHKGRTYIGFTVNPKRRIRQHNGEITAGAWRTKRFRPWDMTLVLYGFATKTQALQFEWAWQNPVKSKAARAAAARLGKAGMAGFGGKIRLLLEMLQEPPWRYFPLTLQFLSTAYAQLAAGGAPLPGHMQLLAAPMDMLPSCINDDEDEDDDDGDEERGGGDDGSTSALGSQGGSTMASGELSGAFSAASGSTVVVDSSDGEDDACSGGTQPSTSQRPPSQQSQQASQQRQLASSQQPAKLDAREKVTCGVCAQRITSYVLHCPSCASHLHVECTAARWGAAPRESSAASSSGGGAMPESGACPCCGVTLSWHALLAGMKSFALWKGKSGKRARGGKRKAAEPKAKRKEGKERGEPAAGEQGAGDAATADAGATAAPAATKRKRVGKQAQMKPSAVNAAASGCSDGDAQAELPAAGERRAAKPRRRPGAGVPPLVPVLLPSPVAEGQEEEALLQQPSPSSSSKLSGDAVTPLAVHLKRRRLGGPSPSAAAVLPAAAAASANGEVVDLCSPAPQPLAHRLQQRLLPTAAPAVISPCNMGLAGLTAPSAGGGAEAPDCIILD